MEQLTISGNQLTFRDDVSTILGASKIDDVAFFIHTDQGSRRFTITGTEINGQSVVSLDDVAAVIQFFPTGSRFTLEDAKSTLRDRIDDNTRDVIAQGFTYNGKVFSLSGEAQTNLTNLKLFDESEFPIAFVTKDDMDYLLIQFSARDAFYNAAKDVVKGIRVANGQKKLQLNGCTTLTQLKALADSFSLKY